MVVASSGSGAATSTRASRTIWSRSREQLTEQADYGREDGCEHEAVPEERHLAPRARVQEWNDPAPAGAEYRDE